MVDGLLNAFRLVAIRDLWTCFSVSQTLLNTSRLAKILVMDFDIVDDDPPFAFGVLCSQGPDVGGLGKTEVCLIIQSVEAVDGEPGVKVSYVSVESEELLEVIFDCIFDLVSWVLGIFQAPAFGSISGASWFVRVARAWMVGRFRLVRWFWTIGRLWMVNWRWWMWVAGCCVIGDGRTDVRRTGSVCYGRHSQQHHKSQSHC